MRTFKRLLIISLLFFCSILLISCKEDEQKKRLEVSDLVINANQFIKENLVSDLYRNTYHLMAPVGWINDPNGFSEFNDTYNLFYQYNPYSGVWGPMHWGHQTTKDFVKWQVEDVALAPDMPYEDGCFSGTAISVDGKLYLAYTAAKEFQNQALAYSYDGITFNKLPELLIDGSKLPEGFSNSDFRDPKIFTRDGKYYILCGNRAPGSKHIIMFKADNVEGPYEYAGIIYNRNDIAGIFECPDLIQIDGKDILIASPQGIKDDEQSVYQNSDSCVYLVGTLSTKTNKFYKETELEEFDKGFSFYAPQTLHTKDGRDILIAWMRSWAEPNTTSSLGWAGSMTLPRELSLVDGHIYQAPVREINNYLKDKVEIASENVGSNETKVLDGFSGNTSKISVTIDVDSMDEDGRAGIELYKNERYSTKVYYDKERGYVVVDRVNCGSLYDGQRYAKVSPVDGKITLDIFLDVNCVEVFINGGYYTMTANIYAPVDALGVALFTKDTTATFTNLVKYNIDVK